MRDPGRSLPRAILISIAITTALYIGVALSVVTLVAPHELAIGGAPLTQAIRVVWPRAAAMLTLIALFATANTVLITLTATCRLVYSLAREGELPPRLAVLSRGRATPWAAVLLTFALAAALVPLGDVKLLAEMSSFAALLGFLSVNLALIALRYRDPDRPRPFRLPGTIGRMPILPLAAVAAILGLLPFFDARILIAGAIAAVVSGLALAARAVARSQ